jgi:MFS family permease
MTVGPVLVAVGTLLMTRIDAGASYLADVLPGVLVMGLGLAATVAPLTATALASVDDRHAGVASGVNTTVARAAQLAAVAAVPLAAGITGASYLDPDRFSDGFRTAMLITAGLSLAGAAIAAVGIRNPERVPEAVPAAAPVVPARWFCGAEGTPLETCPGSSAGDDRRPGDDRAA